MTNWTTLDFGERVSDWWDSLNEFEQKEVIEFEYQRRFGIKVE